MVEDTGKTLRALAAKPVNTPEPVSVREDSSGLPAALGTGRKLPVRAVEDRWRLDDEWWRPEPVSRLYYAVVLASGQRVTLFKDLVNGRWYKQSL
ncbi:MAG: hypothetical protein HYX96_05970 [Chloroflexi bacterium]|nr:hypothetical protein [Chloroflexota bacterium]